MGAHRLGRQAPILPAAERAHQMFTAEHLSRTKRRPQDGCWCTRREASRRSPTLDFLYSFVFSNRAGPDRSLAILPISRLPPPERPPRGAIQEGSPAERPAHRSPSNCHHLVFGKDSNPKKKRNHGLFAPLRAQDAGVQECGVSPAISVRPRRHLQHLQRPAPPHLSEDAPSVPSLCHTDMARGHRCGMIATSDGFVASIVRQM
jgi:hypothetical protein